MLALEVLSGNFWPLLLRKNAALMEIRHLTPRQSKQTLKEAPVSYALWKLCEGGLRVATSQSRPLRIDIYQCVDVTAVLHCRIAEVRAPHLRRERSLGKFQSQFDRYELLLDQNVTPNHPNDSENVYEDLKQKDRSYRELNSGLRKA